MESFYNPTAICFGADILSYALPDVLKKYGDSVLFLSGSSLASNQPFQKTASAIKPHIKKNINNIPPRPDINDLFTLLRQIKGEAYSAILAVGGGSVIDVAKAAGALYNSKAGTVQALRSTIKSSEFSSGKIPVIAVPTTAGSGSETNQWAIIWDRKESCRLSIGNDTFFPVHAIIDPALCVSMPPELTATTGLDILCHAVEGIWAKHSNTISRNYALKAVQIVFEHLEGAIKNPAKMEHREALSIGATMAGVSLSVAKTTCCHAVSYPLTLDYGINHGIACAITLGEIYQYNKGAYRDEQALEELMIKGLGRQSLSNFVKNICSHAGIPTRLADYKITRDALPGLAHRAVTQSSLENNPKAITEGIVLDILKKIY